MQHLCMLTHYTTYFHIQLATNIHMPSESLSIFLGIQIVMIHSHEIFVGHKQIIVVIGGLSFKGSQLDAFSP